MKVLIRDYPKERWYHKLFWKIFRRKWKVFPARPYKVKIDDEDLWNLDYTLALIIKPALEAFKEAAKGQMWSFDNDDVPEHMTIDWDAYWEDSHEFHKETMKRIQDGIDWLYDEMIYAFDRTLKEQIFFPGTLEYDREKNGLRLFAKYFRAMWT